MRLWVSPSVIRAPMVLCALRKIGWRRAGGETHVASLYAPEKRNAKKPSAPNFFFLIYYDSL